MKFAASVLSILSLAGTVVAQPSLSEFLSDPDYSTFLSALELTGVDATLFGGGPFTVFVPPNSGFEQLQAFSPGTLELLMSESPPNTLTQILLYHVADGAIESTNITSDMQLLMLNGESTNLTVGPPLLIDFFPITTADIAVQEGVRTTVLAWSMKKKTPGLRVFRLHFLIRFTNSSIGSLVCAFSLSPFFGIGRA